MSDMSSVCESYFSEERVFVEGFTCPRADSDAAALFCCGFGDLKYCCDDHNSFFPYEFGYMWWLSFGALVGLSVAGAGVLALVVSLSVFCYVAITAKPKALDNGLELQATEPHLTKTGLLGSTLTPQRPGPSPLSAPTGPPGLKKPFLRGELDCDNPAVGHPLEPDCLFQPCFTATVTSINVNVPA